MRERWVETVVGVVVLAIAAAFLVYALDAGGGRRGAGGYVLTARFDQAGGLAPGASVQCWYAIGVRSSAPGSCAAGPVAT